MRLHFDVHSRHVAHLDKCLSEGKSHEIPHVVDRFITPFTAVERRPEQVKTVA